MNNVPQLVLPKRRVAVSETDTMFFLAGPVRGGRRWQIEAFNRLSELLPNSIIASPLREEEVGELINRALPDDPTQFDPKIAAWMTESQTNWERFYLDAASRLGCVLFWLPEQDPLNPRPADQGPYARDTYGEIGRWSMLKSLEPERRMVIGAMSAFDGLKQIKTNLRADHGYEWQIFTSLEDTIQATVEESKKPKTYLHQKYRF